MSDEKVIQLNDMTEFLRAFGTDEKKEIDGKWFNIGMKNRLGKEMKLKICRTQTPQHRAFLDTGLSDTEKAILSEFSFDDAEYAPVAAKIFANCLVKDWEGFIDSNGREIKYSVKQAVPRLEQLKQMRVFVLSKATQWENFRVELEAKALKN